jgi:hypothetical protein
MFFIEKHFDLKDTTPSPFIVLTADIRKVEKACEAWRKSGQLHGVKILELDLHAWATSTRKPIWRVKDLVLAFGLPWKETYRDEYLVADAIDGARVFGEWS